MQEPSITSRKLPGWGAIAFFAATLIVGRLFSGVPKRNRRMYSRELQQAPWAPPGWAFGPAWTLNNVLIVRALWKILRQPALVRSDRQLLVLQGILWTIFCSFGYVYFRKRSTLLAAVWTQADMIAALASVLIARHKSGKLAAHYVPLLAWTSYASTVAWYQAYENDDEALGTKALKRLLS